MKSQLFLKQKSSINLETVKKSFETLLDFDLITIQKISKIIEDNYEDGIDIKLDLLIEYVRGHKFSADQLLKGIRYIHDLAFLIDKNEDKCEDVIDDFIEDDILQAELKKKYLEVINAIQEQFVRSLKKRYINVDALRNLSTIRSFVIENKLIPTFKPEFDSQKDKLEEYNPEIENLIPISKIYINFYTDFRISTKSFSFHLREDVIDDIINKLLAAKIELNKLKTNLSFNKLNKL